MTFYYHFRDIYDLVEWACLEDARRALEEKRTHDTWQQGLLQIFRAVQANRPFILNVYRCVDRAQVESYLNPLVDDLLMGVVEEQSAGLNVPEEDKAFIARAYAHVFVGLTLDWIRGDMREPPERIVEKLALLLQDTFRRALEPLRPRPRLNRRAILFKFCTVRAQRFKAEHGARTVYGARGRAAL